MNIILNNTHHHVNDSLTLEAALDSGVTITGVDVLSTKPAASGKLHAPKLAFGCQRTSVQGKR